MPPLSTLYSPSFIIPSPHPLHPLIPAFPTPAANPRQIAPSAPYESGIWQTTAVGRFPAGRNPALDLYDLSGNVWEWCRNKYQNPEDTAVDKSGAWRGLRGGSWGSSQGYARAAYRSHNQPFYRNYYAGFRLVGRPPSPDR